MKKQFESPTLESYEFVVAARLEGSGTGDAHSNSPGSTCSKVASNGGNSCTAPSLPNSNIGNVNCAS